MRDYEALKNELAAMKPRQRLYELVKSEIKKRGHWKEKPRYMGNPDNFTKKKKNIAP